MWVLIALLLILSLGFTVLCAANVIVDIGSLHWTDAAESLPIAVPAVGSWAALFKALAKDGTVAVERMLSVDDLEVEHAEERAGWDQYSAKKAEILVRNLTEQLATAAARRDAAGADGEPGASEEFAEIEAGLEQARRSLASAQQAAAASQASLAGAKAKLEQDYPDPRS